MKITPIAVATIGATIFTMSANANPLFDLYAGATIGVGAQTLFADKHADTHSAQSFGGSLGVDLPIVRIEAEYNYLRNNNLSMNIAMANAYLKMATPLVMPYLGAGAGMVFDGDMDDAPDTTIKKTAAYQGMLGLTFDVPALPIKIDAEARAIYIPNIYVAQDIKPDALQYDARLKLRYIF